MRTLHKRAISIVGGGSNDENLAYALKIHHFPKGDIPGMIEFGSCEQIFQKPQEVLTQNYVSGHFG